MIANAERGLIDADLGGGIIKQRVARRGQGKSGGFRTVIVYRRGLVAFFVYGFAKNERSDLTSDELEALKELASSMLAYNDRQIGEATASGVLKEVRCDEKGQDEVG